MKHLLILLFFTFFIHINELNAQSHADSLQWKIKKDSLERLVAGKLDDTLKVLQQALLSSIGYPTSKLQMENSEKVLMLSEKLHFKNGIAIANFLKGEALSNTKEFDSAIIYYQKAIDLCETDQYYFDSAFKYLPFGSLLNTYFYLGDYPKAMETITQEMKLAEKTNDKKKIAHCNNIRGYIYFKQENYQEAETCYYLFINNAKELNDSVMLTHALGEISDVYTNEKKIKLSINVLHTTILLCEKLLLSYVPRNTNYNITDCYNYKYKAMYRLGKTYKLKGDLDTALYYSLEALKYNANAYDSATYYINAGDVYKRMKKYTNAICYLDSGLNVATRIEHKENRRDAAELLFQVYDSLNKIDKAYYFLKLFTGLKDSIVSNETKMKIAGIQGKYDVSKIKSKKQQQINILIGGFAFLLILISILYNSYRLKQKEKFQQEQNRQQNELFNAIVSTQDIERKRIAQDIHDSVGSMLSAAKLKLSSLEESKKTFSHDEREKYNTTLSLLDEASTELRNISHNIMPATLSKLGIVAALQNLIDKLSSPNSLQINFTAHEFEERIEEAIEISIYRIILELINNIVKHAEADKINIQLIKYPAYINLIIEDNGIGFDFAKAIETKKGIGLGNILSRVEYLKGTIDFDSSNGKGTTVIVEIPCK